jgi:hypothetical protein
MMSYEPVSRPEFSGIENEQGIIYHQRGNFALVGPNLNIPVNRCYRPLDTMRTAQDGQRSHAYVYDKLIHDTIPTSSSLEAQEKIVRILGKDLLYLSIAGEDEIKNEYSSYAGLNPFLSPEAQIVIETLKSKVEKRVSNIQLGVHGSHEVGLNRADSDVDLVAWIARKERTEGLAAIDDALRSRGYVRVNDTAKFNEYAMRIANLTGLPYQAGLFLAGQRNRWLSPSGTPTSLQLIHNDYAHTSAKTLVDTAISGECELVSRVAGLSVEIIDHCEPFNYPRFWTIFDGSEEAEVLSFNMVHQGMGTDGRHADNHSGEYTLAAHRWTTPSGRSLYFMKDDKDFLLPANLGVS